VSIAATVIDECKHFPNHQNGECSTHTDLDKRLTIQDHFNGSGVEPFSVSMDGSLPAGVRQNMNTATAPLDKHTAKNWCAVKCATVPGWIAFAPSAPRMDNPPLLLGNEHCQSIPEPDQYAVPE